MGHESCSLCLIKMPETDTENTFTVIDRDENNTMHFSPEFLSHELQLSCCC